MDVVAIQDYGDREDGEIVDDFDDISDCSIPSVGKCENELLRAISLSSISDSCDERSVHIPNHDRTQSLDVDGRLTTQRRTPQNRKRKRRHRQHQEPKRRYSPESFVDLAADPSSSDEESIQVDKEMLRKLKEAVHIDNHNEHQNSLRSRLKAMINNVNSSESEDEEIETLRTLALLSNSKSDTDKDGIDLIAIDEVKEPEPELVDILDDRELLELRSAALKSAVLKKHHERKKRKEHIEIVDNTDVNKENTATNDMAKESDNNQVHEKAIDSNIEALVTVPLQENCEENKDTSVEEDVDIMRAMLLASMSTKITNKIIPTIEPTPKILPKKLPIALNRTKKALLPKLAFSLPPVKPLIININNDSDSESDVKSPTKRPVEDPISQSVTAFLKIHRQQFEAKEGGIAAVTQSGNPPSNGVILNSNANNNREIKMVTKEANLRKDISGVKLLSKAQQREYQILKRKLLVAKQKKLIERIKSSEVKRVENAQKTPHTLKQTLTDLQFRENGRLRVKGKYNCLAGLLQLVNGASVERQLCETRMKRLLDELTVAKGQLGQAHRKFTHLVQNLIREKNNIDARFTKIDPNSTKLAVTIPVQPVKSSMLVPFKANIIAMATSTPKKGPIPETKLKISDIISETNALVREHDSGELLQNNGGSTAVTESTEEPETNVVGNGILEDEVTTSASENILIALPKIEGALKYISPLDNRTSATDPLGTICPYELFGDCKDASCRFVHCGKS